MTIKLKCQQEPFIASPNITHSYTIVVLLKMSVPMLPIGMQHSQPAPLLTTGSVAPPLLSAVLGYSCYVSNISPDCEEKFLKEIFNSIGDFQEWKGVTDPVTGKCRGFGFVTFSSPAHFRLAIKILDGLEIDGKKMKIKVDGATKFRLESAEEMAASKTEEQDPAKDTAQEKQLENSDIPDGTNDDDDDKDTNDNNGENDNDNDNNNGTLDEEEILKKILLLIQNRENEMGNNNSNHFRQGYNNKDNRKRAADGVLENELKKRKQRRGMEEKRKMVNDLVIDFYGKIDSDVVTFLMDKVLKSSSYGMEDPEIKADLQLLFAEDLPWVLQRLKGQ